MLRTIKNSNIPVAATALHLDQSLAPASTLESLLLQKHAESVLHQAASIESTAWRKNAAQIPHRNRTEPTQKLYRFTQKLCLLHPERLNHNRARIAAGGDHGEQRNLAAQRLRRRPHHSYIV